MQGVDSQGKSHSHRVCPWWFGYLLLGPIRRMRYDPSTILGPYLHEGMTVLEPGPGMGSSRLRSLVQSEVQAA